jgi:hypothetical protein
MNTGKDMTSKERRVNSLLVTLMILHQEHDVLEKILNQKGTCSWEVEDLRAVLNYIKSRIEHYRGIIKSIK